MLFLLCLGHTRYNNTDFLFKKVCKITTCTLHIYYISRLGRDKLANVNIEREDCSCLTHYTLIHISTYPWTLKSTDTKRRMLLRRNIFFLQRYHFPIHFNTVFFYTSDYECRHIRNWSSSFTCKYLNDR